MDESKYWSSDYSEMNRQAGTQAQANKHAHKHKHSVQKKLFSWGYCRGKSDCSCYDIVMQIYLQPVAPKLCSSSEPSSSLTAIDAHEPLGNIIRILFSL